MRERLGRVARIRGAARTSIGPLMYTIQATQLTELDKVASDEHVTPGGAVSINLDESSDDPRFAE